MYFLLLLGIVLLIAIVIILFKFKKPIPIVKTIPPEKPPLVITSKDIKAIAGDNVISTQLDLARAYIEMGKKKFAKKILNHVMEKGDEIQQREAEVLITLIETP